MRQYTCMTFSKPNEEFLFVGTESGDFFSFQVKNRLYVFKHPVCAMGINFIQAITRDKIAVGGGDGQIVLFHVE